MKKLFGFIFAIGLVAFVAPVFAQDAAAAGTDIGAAIGEFLASFVAKYPVLASVFGVMGIARAIFKPLMVFLHAVADATPTTKDNELLAKAESGPIGKVVKFIADYVLSIKLPQK